MQKNKFTNILPVNTVRSSAFVNVIRLGCDKEGGVHFDSHISHNATHNGLYAYEHFLQVHIRGDAADVLIHAFLFG